MIEGDLSVITREKLDEIDELIIALGLKRRGYIKN